MASLLTGCWCRMLAKLRDNVLAGVLSVLHLHDNEGNRET